MPSPEDVEMGNSSSSSSDIREVEMEDAGSSSEEAVESAQPESTTSKGHMTSEERGKNDKDESSNINGGHESEALSSSVESKSGEISRDQEMTESSADVDPEMPVVEADESNSPATADEDMTSPAVEAPPQGNAALPKSQRDPQTDVESPTASQTIKWDKQIARLNEVLAEISPEAAQKVLKDKWRLFLFENYDEAHIAFIIRAGLKNANAAIVERVLKDDGVFKDSLLKHAAKKPGFLDKILKNTPVETIADHIPEQALDYMIAERFKTVPGKTLIKWLATAERLGYKEDDILDEEDESVSPNVPSRDRSVEVLDVAPIPTYQQPTPQYHQPYPPQQPLYQPHLASSYKDPLLMEQERQAILNTQQAQHVQAAIARSAQSAQASSNRRAPSSTILPPGPGSNFGPVAAMTRQEQHVRVQAQPTGPLICNNCHRSFLSGAFDGYTYHITKKVCEKIAPVGGYKWQCLNCLSGFTTKQGLDYHSLRRVCFGGGFAPPTPVPVSTSVGPRTLPPPVSSGVSQLPRTASTPILPPPRPPLYAPPPPSQAPQSHNPQVVASSQSARPIAQTPQPPVQIPRPPLATPRGPGRPKKEEPIRHSPSELTPEKRASLEKALQDAEAEAAQKISKIPSDLPADERQRRLTSINNANATKKSQIRRAHGVSLRMREKDKKARAAAGISPSATSRIQEFRASNSPAGSPPASSFSPINGNTATYSGPPQPATAYRPPPPSAAKRVFNPMSSQPSGHDVPLTHARQQDTSTPSGFGVLKASTPSHITPTSYAASSALATYQVNNKRKHGSQEPIGSQNGTPQLSMMEVSTEDAAAKFAKGYQKKLADREREDRERSKSKDKDTAMADVPNGEGSRNEAAIDISSDSEDVEPPPMKSVEGDGEESEGASKRAVGGNMARRGEDESTGEGSD
ncbi:hypothetical protein ONS95_009790 [Cadophora gregata]|uniref:uncharacterized protein n=1 Tax=Cadophora gregata TaxID=51156 RepID=UPI0026DC60B7|nr:uncharacterized protein ONS95_009790 [Cadophora gregata]KAK0121496.1 hypothetical protein ONS95_009790 [Cadophora gregata]